MRSVTLRSIILGFTLLMAGIILLQLYWLRRQYAFEQNQFNLNVIKAIRGLYEDIDLTDNRYFQLSELIERPDEKTFLIRIDTIPERDTLAFYLGNELVNFDVYSDSRMAVYSHSIGTYVYQKDLPSGAHRKRQKDQALPVMKKDFSYINLFFPYRNEYVLEEMKWLIALSLVLVLILTGLGLSIFFLYRQKFLNEIQGDFIKNVTHEFQTPLTTLTLGLDMLSKPDVYQHPKKMEKYTSVMRSQVDYLKSHMEKLIKVIRTDSIGMEIKKEKTDPQEQILRAAHQLHFLIDEKNSVLHYDWKAAGKFIMADTENLYLVVLNILSNAIKYSKQPVIHIQTKLEDGWYTISVQDNGVGISDAAKKNIFKKFYRIPSGDLHDAKGLGLGLYFVKKIMDAHHGKINVMSKEGEGSTFKLFFPV